MKFYNVNTPYGNIGYSVNGLELDLLDEVEPSRFVEIFQICLDDHEIRVLENLSRIPKTIQKEVPYGLLRDKNNVGERSEDED